MANPRNPLLARNRRKSFTGAEVTAAFERLAASKKARVVRERSEFDMRGLERLLRAPFTSATAGSWTLEQIFAARDAQMAGRFQLPARLSESFSTDGALFTARKIRLAPVQSLETKITPAKSGKGDRIADEADALFGCKGIAISSDSEQSIRTHLVDHGVAFGAISWTPRADGSRWDPVVNAWPIEFAWWDAVANCYVTQVRRPVSDPEPTAGNLFGASGAVRPGSHIEPIIHGNGRWIVFAKSEITPHRFDATLLPAAMVWPSRAFGARDWRKGSAVTGNAKVVGELPDGIALTDESGNPTQEASAFMTLLAAIASQDSPYGIKPFGSKVDILTNQSRAWEIFAELVGWADREAARIYLGTDGILGAQGGAPGIDVQALFGVASSVIQTDLRCLERALQSGLIGPWTAINFGDDRLAPTREYVFPDADDDAVRQEFARRNTAFNADIAAYRANGFLVDQALVDKLAELHGVPAPLLAGAPAPIEQPSAAS